jgi:hypothetical protein
VTWLEERGSRYFLQQYWNIFLSGWGKLLLIKDYEKFKISWVREAPRSDKERLIVDTVSYLLPKLHKYRDFILRESKTGTEIEVVIWHHTDAFSLRFELGYDNVRGVFDLRVLDTERIHKFESLDFTILGDVEFPEEVRL